MGAAVAISIVVTFIITLVVTALITYIITSLYYKHLNNYIRKSVISQAHNQHVLTKNNRSSDPAYDTVTDPIPAQQTATTIEMDDPAYATANL